MSKTDIFIGDHKAVFPEGEVRGELIDFDNEKYYKISNSDSMRPFFMSIVSDSNHWMFISSNGGLTAGRKNAQNSLFPYYTDDKITESAHITGSKTIVQIHKDDKVILWEPFATTHKGIYTTTRNLYKNRYGNKVIFEEINHDLKLTYRYHWNSSDQYGFIKKAELINENTTAVKARVLDGLQNILPASVGSDLQNASSNLVDAYKRSELKEDTGIGVIALSAVIVDKAEPSEALKANTVWSLGMDNPTYLLSSLQLDRFRKGMPLQQEVDVKAEKGAYFTVSDMTLQAQSQREWRFVANVNQSITDVNHISHLIQTDKTLTETLQADVDLGTRKLIELTAASDGLQLTADPLNNNRHFANTLFNIMRGGIFDDNYTIEKRDFASYIAAANKEVYKAKKAVLNDMPDLFTLNDIKTVARREDDKDFKRLCYEYMPLKFSRRHGDPSRPWNKFSINTRSEVDGSKILDYEGNWRDIFQNWEALAHSYPEFIESMIHKFLNATTFEGYNPYRVTKGGFDWEVIEEDDPWSYIGYWGDHQIIYLLKFLEFIENYYPNRLSTLFTQDIFVYANVPYKIKSYQETLDNPKDTIDFDYRLNEQIDEERERLGADGALLKDENNAIYRVTLIEKLLATVLAKVSNFIPEGGIWLNTQRPEWNDANNALVGNGVSMVTLYYLRRFLNFFNDFMDTVDVDNAPVSQELASFFNNVLETLQSHHNILDGKVSDTDRKTVLDGLGQAGSTYRETIYNNGFSSDKASITKADLKDFIKVTLQYLDHSIEANKRDDNMYHAYNLMTVESDTEVSISYLSEMLEGQVAALSSGYLSPQQALSLLDGLKSSALFRDDQYSYILYPNKELPGFEVKNNIPAIKVENSQLLQQLVADGNTQIVEKDINGVYHFNASFNNVKSLRNALDNLPEDKYDDLVNSEKKELEKIFESVFNHKAFTGRSGTFFGYEGLGSIYWHMVSKLSLAVQENCWLAINTGQSEELIGKMFDHYFEIQAGIGVHKSPQLYGAFPTDPYSHTPATKGAQQPGMTGQVKEDVLSRIGELGVFVKDGLVQFNPRILRKQEFLNAPKTFNYLDVSKEAQALDIPSGSLCFTYCQVPVVYTVATSERLTVNYVDGTSAGFENLTLDRTTSEKLFTRSGEIKYIEVEVVK